MSANIEKANGGWLVRVYDNSYPGSATHVFTELEAALDFLRVEVQKEPKPVDLYGSASLNAHKTNPV